MKHVRFTFIAFMMSLLAFTGSDISCAKTEMKKNTAPQKNSVQPKVATVPINEALISAYMTNSTLKAKVYQQFANQENIDIAFSGFRPAINAYGNVAKKYTRTNQGSITGTSAVTGKYTVKEVPYGGNVQLQQNLFQGGGTVAALTSAREEVRAGHYDLLNTEQTTLLNAASAYLNIIYTKAAVKYNKENVKFLTESLKSIEAQVEVGEKTKTDTAQAESALAKGYADLTTAEGNYQDAVANYINVVGEKPEGQFIYPKTLPDLPPSKEDLIRMALLDSPVVLQAKYQYEKARSDVNVQAAKLLPTVDLVGSLERDLDHEQRTGYRKGVTQTNVASARLQLTVPIYQRGAQWATVRQSADTEGQARYQLEQARKTTRENAIKAWESWIVSKQNTESYRKQVEFATLFRDGAVLEEQVGERAYLDVLQAQSQLLQAQTQLEQAKRDERIAEYQLYATVGILTAKFLNLPVQEYAERAHLKAVEYKPFGFGPSPITGDMIQ